MSSFREASIEVLRQAKEPFHYKEIARRALEAGLLESGGATPESSMNSRIIIDIKAKGERSSFVKKSPSTYAINPIWRPEEKDREFRGQHTDCFLEGPTPYELPSLEILI
jgi:hypothetical protein